MYEEMTFSNILKNMLESVPDDMDKRQGSIIYDAIAPICAELAKAYIELDYVMMQGFADTANRQNLIRRAMERGMKPFGAIKSIVLATFWGNINIEKGAKFSTEDDIIFIYTGEKEGEYYKLQCEKEGIIGNIGYGELLPINNIQGLQKASIYKIFVAGKEEEETEKFRERYLKSFKSQAFGGNRADYLEKIMLLNRKENVSEQGGIGGIKVYRDKEGGGNVRVLITDNNYTVPKQELLDIVKQELDPKESSGDGIGVAPIGHKVSVNPVLGKNIDIDIKIEIASNYTKDMLKQKIEEKIDKYIEGVRKKWENEVRIIIRISHIESIVLNIDGIEDVGQTKINGTTTNLELNTDEVPIRRYIYVT